MKTTTTYLAATALLSVACGSQVTVMGGDETGTGAGGTVTTSTTTATTSSTSGPGGAPQGGSGPSATGVGAGGLGGAGGELGTGGSGAGSVDPWECPLAAPDCRRVFVTSTLHTGNLGGLAGADQICQDLADAAGHGGTWKAWLSTEATAAADRLEHSAVPYVRRDGAIIADDWVDLTDGSLHVPVGLTEAADDPAKTFAWTGTFVDGDWAWEGSPPDALGERACNGWTSEEQSATADGRVNAANHLWTNSGGGFSCHITAHVYCFEQP